MKTLALFLVSFLLVSNAISQDLPKSRLCFGVGIDIGFFYPTDVNNYIEDNLPSGYATEYGFTGMYSNYGLHVLLGYKIYKNWEFQWVSEAAMAPKFIIYNGTESGDSFYDFWRISSGIMANVHIPTNAYGKHSFFFGVGPILHYMTFKDYSGATIGPRLQVGFSLNNYKFNPQVYLAADYANVSDNGFNLNYSSIKIGVNANF